MRLSQFIVANVEPISEYRALRANVLRLWRASFPHPDLDDIDDLTRFSESIDQSLAEAVGSYTERVNRSRQFFLAILGHDLRNPLNSIRMGAYFVSRANGDPESAEMLSMIATETEVMAQLISDLLEYASTWLGDPIPLNPEPVDLEKLFREVIDGFRTTSPQRTLRYHPRGDLSGLWDAARGSRRVHATE